MLTFKKIETTTQHLNAECLRGIEDIEPDYTSKGTRLFDDFFMGCGLGAKHARREGSDKFELAIKWIRRIYNKNICVRCALNIFIHTQNYPRYVKACGNYHRPWGQIHGMALKSGLLNEVCIYLNFGDEKGLYSFQLAKWRNSLRVKSRIIHGLA